MSMVFPPRMRDAGTSDEGMQEGIFLEPQRDGVLWTKAVRHPVLPQGDSPMTVIAHRRGTPSAPQAFQPNDFCAIFLTSVAKGSPGERLASLATKPAARAEPWLYKPPSAVRRTGRGSAASATMMLRASA